MYLEGMSHYAIAEKMRSMGFHNRYGSWNRDSSVARVISSEVYTGRVKFNNMVTHEAHEAIIAKEQFEQAQKIRAQRHEIYGGTSFQGNYLLSSMMFCGQCGARYHMQNAGSRNGKPRRWYACYSRSKSNRLMVKNPDCKNKHWNPEEIENIVEGEVRELLFNPSKLKRLIREHKKPAVKTPAVLTNRIAEIDKRIDKLMKLYQTDDIPTDVLGAQISALYDEKVKLQETIPPEPAEVDFGLMKELIDDAAATWDFADINQKRRILETFVKRIVLDEEDVAIEWIYPE